MVTQDSGLVKQSSRKDSERILERGPERVSFAWGGDSPVEAADVLCRDPWVRHSKGSCQPSLRKKG